MSHTNSTTNYNLPQFVGTDKPTWLNDVNGAFSAIDTQMKANADSATQAGTDATTAKNAVGTLSSLNTETKTDAVSAINEVNTNLGTVSGVASQASSDATQAKNGITAIADYLNFTKFKNYSASDITNVSGFANINVADLSCASNEEGSVGKIYGQIMGTCNSSNGFTITFPSHFRPSQNITINGVAFAKRYSGGLADAMMQVPIQIATDGTITITRGSTYYNNNVTMNLVACVLFLKDFGDVPSPD